MSHRISTLEIEEQNKTPLTPQGGNAGSESLPDKAPKKSVNILGWTCRLNPDKKGKYRGYRRLNGKLEAIYFGNTFELNAATKRIELWMKGYEAKKADEPIEQLINYYCASYQQRFGAKYTRSEKDGDKMRSPLQDHSPETLRRCIDAFLSDNDPWLNGKRTINVFQSRINQYVQLQIAPVPAACQDFE